MTGSPLVMRLSRLFSRLAPVAAVLFLLSIADIFLSGYLEPKHLYRGLPGSEQAISGELADPVHSLTDLSYVTSTPRVRLLFDETRGKLWRGRLQIDPQTPAGEYRLRVFAGKNPPGDDLLIYRIQVHSDKAHLNASYLSMSRRYLGMAPIWPVLFAFLLVICGLAASYLLSSLQEQKLASQDIVPIAKMARTKQGWEIHFALGLRQGVHPRDTLLLLDSRFVPAGRIIVERVEAEHSCALVPFTKTIAPNYWLAKAQEQKIEPAKI